MRKYHSIGALFVLALAVAACESATANERLAPERPSADVIYGPGSLSDTIHVAGELVFQFANGSSLSFSSDSEGPKILARNNSGQAFGILHFTDRTLAYNFSDGNQVAFVSTGVGVLVAGKAQGQTSNVGFAYNGGVSVGATEFLVVADKLGLYGQTPVTRPVVTGDRSSGSYAASLLTALHNEGAISNSTTP